jgi:hypothetical protein
MMWPKLVFSLMCDSNNYDLTVWSLLLLLGCKIDSRQWWSVVCLRRLSISSKTTTKKSILFFINSKLRYCCYSLVIHMFNHVFRQVQVVVNQLDHLLRRKLVRKNVPWSIHQVELFHFMVFQCLVKKKFSFFRYSNWWSSVAPMCFVFEDPIHLYFIFRQFYMKYFFNLHHISASPNVRKKWNLVFFF